MSDIQEILHRVDDHFHSVQKVYPTGAAYVTVTSGGGAWTLGALTQIVPATTITELYDLHWIDYRNPDTNADYELVLYQGAGDVEIGRDTFSRLQANIKSFQNRIQTTYVPPNARIRAALMDSVGGSAVGIKLKYHTY